jgi:hypothetical protein
VVKHGLLYKKGELLKMYNNQYHFYLERRDDTHQMGPLLKYGRKGKPITYCLDLGSGGSTQKTLVIKNQESRTKFKIVTPLVTLRVRSENKEERDKWSHHLLQELARISSSRDSLRSGSVSPNGKNVATIDNASSQKALMTVQSVP